MNRYQELQQQNSQLKETVRSLQEYRSSINNYRRIKRYEQAQRMKTIDWTLNRATDFRAIPLYCDCKQCAGLNRMLDWTGRSLVKWDGEPGACVYRVGIQLARIALLRNEDIDPFIMAKLLKIARQL